MTKIEKTAQRANLIASLSKHAWSALNLVGATGWLSGLALTISGLVWTAALRMTTDLPWWAFALIILVATVLFGRLLIELRRAWALRGVKRLDVAQLGADCVRFRSDVLSFLVDRVNGAPDANEGLLAAPEDREIRVRAAFARRSAYDNQTRARVIERYGARAMALNQMLIAAGITPINLWGLDHRAAGIATHIGAIGELLERGLLDDAKALAVAEDYQRPNFYLG